MIKLEIKGLRPEKENDNYIIDAVVSSDDIKTTIQLENMMRNFPDDSEFLRFFGGSLIFTDVTFVSICIAVNYLSLLYNTDSYIVVDVLDIDESIKEELIHIAEFYYEIKGGNNYA